jgi:hypothetical protein
MRKVALVVGLLLLGGGALAQTIPDELLSVLQANPVAPEFLLERASLFLESALASGALSVEKAKELLEILHWPELGEEEIGFAVRALELALIALSTGSATVTEVLNRLSQAVAEGVLGPLASETKALSGLPGLASSLLKLAVPLNPELWNQIETLAAARVPLGLIGHTVRELAKTWCWCDATEITAALSELTPPGRYQVREHLRARENFRAPESEEEEKVPPGKGGKKK